MGLLDRIFSRRRREDDLEQEIAAHLAMAAAERVAAGQDPAEARRAAVKDFGNVTLTREATRLSWGARWMDHAADLARDVRYALRLLARSPGYSLVIVTVLTIGIGTNLVAFGFYNALALSPLSGVPRSSDLVVITAATRSGRPLMLPYGDYKYLHDHANAFEGLAASDFTGFAIGRGAEALHVFGERVSGNYFDVLGVEAQFGRTIGPSDDLVPGGHPVVVISDSLWRRVFLADPAIVGRIIHVNSVPLTVIGVTGPDFHGAVVGVDMELFVPVMMQPALSGGWNALASRDAPFLVAIGRPRAGITLAQARDEARRLGQQLAIEWPIDQVSNRALLLPIRESPYGVQTYGAPIVRLTGATAVLLLLVVCANVAGLVLVRTLSRRSEIAARLALGATRWRLARLLLVENLLLAVPSACLGLMIPGLADSFLTSTQRSMLSVRLHFNWDAGLLPLVAVSLAATSALLCGLLPALKASRIDVASAVKDTPSLPAPSTSRLRSILVVCQVAASLVLLVGTALTTRSLAAARGADPGFDPRPVASVMVDVRAAGYDEAEGRHMFDRLRAELRALPEVEAVSLMRLPLLMVYDFGVREFSIEGHAPRREDDLQFGYNIISPDHFRTLSIGLVAGRDFDERDDASAAAVAIVNETMATTFWGGAPQAIGRRIRTPDWRTTIPRWLTIVGVARDIKYTRLNEEPRPYVYFPFAQTYVGSMYVHVRGSETAARLLDRVARQVRAVDANVPIVEAKPLTDQLRAGVGTYEVAARVLAFVGLAAIALSALGIYGLVAYTASQRVREIGIRLALGAPRAGIVHRFLMGGLRLGAAGAAIGILASLATSRVMASLLYGIAATDPVSFATAGLAVLFVALLASVVPAWRAARLDPLAALRR
jgi:macrolide transport system ATP-binding/permease protein